MNALPETANFLLASIVGLKIMHMLSVPRGRKTWRDTAPPKKFIFFIFFVDVSKRNQLKRAAYE